MPFNANFFWATFFVLLVPHEFSTGACPTPSGLEIGKTHHCALPRQKPTVETFSDTPLPASFYGSAHIHTSKKEGVISNAVELIGEMGLCVKDA